MANNNTANTNQNAMMWVITLGLLLIVAGTVMPIIQGSLTAGVAFKYVYTAGAVMTLIGRLFSPYKGTNLQLKRLYRIESWTSIIFCVGAFFMFYEPGARDWIAFTLAGGALLIFTSIRIPQVAKKAENDSKK